MQSVVYVQKCRDRNVPRPKCPVTETAWSKLPDPIGLNGPARPKSRALPAASLKKWGLRRPLHSRPIISTPDWSVWTRSQMFAALVSKWRWQVLVGKTKSYFLIYLKSMAMLVWKEHSCLGNVQIFYCRATISEMAKFLTASMVTFRNNKQALYSIFQYVLTTPNHRKTVPLPQILLHNRLNAVQKGMFLSTIPNYIFFQRIEW